MSKVFKIIKIGKSIDSTDPNDFIFNSSYNTLKIIKKATLTSQSITANPTTITIAHNQLIVPAVYAYVKYPDGYVAMANGRERADTHPLDRYFWLEVNSTNIYFLFYKGSSANYSVDLTYYIFETPL